MKPSCICLLYGFIIVGFRSYDGLSSVGSGVVAKCIPSFVGQSILTGFNRLSEYDPIYDDQPNDQSVNNNQSTNRSNVGQKSIKHRQYKPIVFYLILLCMFSGTQAIIVCFRRGVHPNLFHMAPATPARTTF